MVAFHYTIAQMLHFQNIFLSQISHLFPALPAILVPRHTLTNDDSNIYTHSLDDVNTSVPENTSFPHNTNTLGYEIKRLL